MENIMEKVLYEGIWFRITQVLNLVVTILFDKEPWSQVFGLKVINERYLSKESLWAVLSVSDHPPTVSGDFCDVFDSFECW